MSFPRYESDKDSGVEWLGDIDADPKHCTDRIETLVEGLRHE